MFKILALCLSLVMISTLAPCSAQAASQAPMRLATTNINTSSSIASGDAEALPVDEDDEASMDDASSPTAAEIDDDHGQDADED